MKPVRLTLQAFGPYAGCQVIDFREAIQAGLFGIYGQTGSGKSTIFSAMTFALFGQPAKADQDAPSLRSDHADAATATEVEFVFDIAGKRYVVVRRPDQMRPKQRGGGETKSTHDAFLFDATGIALNEIHEGHRGRIVAEKKVRDVDLAIEGILGYGPDQFRQIVLLPQGRFEKFLAAKTKDRLAILRELFDVSLYNRLMQRLKTDAETAERSVRQERDICMGRLKAENFESIDALANGISETETQLAAARDTEQGARTAFATAQQALQQGEQHETQFKAAEVAQQLLTTLLADQPGMDALAVRVAQTERARLLVDPQAGVTAGAEAVTLAEAGYEQARKAVENTTARERAAADALQSEMSRAGEIEDLRRTLDELERHQGTLEEAADCAKALDQARGLERDAATRLATTQGNIGTLQAQRSQKSEARKKAEQTEARRNEMAIRLHMLKTEVAASQAFEKAQKTVQDAQTNVEVLTTTHQAASAKAQTAHAAFARAEQDLSAAQALHLASKLAPGEPCSVCGSIEHPAPATGTIENAGRELAFRDTKATWEKARADAHDQEKQLSGAQSILKERQEHLAGLDQPAKPSSTLLAEEKAEREALNKLGPKIDIVEVDAEIARLESEAARLETARETLQAELSKRQQESASEDARQKQMLAKIPEALRDRATLAAKRATTTQALATRQDATQKAQAAATTTHDVALGARKDLEAADSMLASARDRHQAACGVFIQRLDQVGLSEQEFVAFKPYLATMDQDRVRVNEHKRRLENAREAADAAAMGIQELARPNLTVLTSQRGEAENVLNAAIDHRSAVGHHVDHLAKLRDSLADTLRRLDEAEAASGTLRNLSTLINGDNAQRLDLETFAIGAMFDQVLEAANLRLGPMTAQRYRMQRDQEGSGRGRRGLGIEVYDVHTGKARPTATLSGGETFIAALALALGLADIVESANGKVRLDTIFIDEGFGSLDAENGSGTLDKVLDVLNTLVSQNRAVGLISHVPLVQEAIPNGFYVRKYLTGSQVEARGLL